MLAKKVFFSNISGISNLKRSRTASRKAQKIRSDAENDYESDRIKLWNDIINGTPTNSKNIGERNRLFKERMGKLRDKKKRDADRLDRFSSKETKIGITKAALSATALAAALGISVYAARKLIKKLKNKKSEN